MRNPAPLSTIAPAWSVPVSRRRWLQVTGGLSAAAGASWLPQLAAYAQQTGVRPRSCILLWMSGGPSHIDLFDLKPEHENGGEFKPIDTSAPGVQICEHLPKLAEQAKHLAIIRSMSTKEGDHARATHVMRTGYLPQGPIQYPALGSLLSKELITPECELPGYVSISPFIGLAPAAFGPGFLGPQYAPLIVGSSGPGQSDDALRVQNVESHPGTDASQVDRRLSLLQSFEADFAAARPGLMVDSHRSAYASAVRMMRSDGIKAFDLGDEPAELRDRYGRNTFGQGCLLARRLVERGVPFVEVSFSGTDGALGWDTHQQNFPTLKTLCGTLDPAWAALMEDLGQRGLLDSTLIVWMGEFGRTPKINNNAGRDHFPAAWSTVLGGGGIRGGQVVGKTGEDGMTVAERPVTTADLLATVVQAVGLDPTKQNMSNIGRPIRLADPEAKPIEEVLA
jgi:uncharacterized protein (DUF1501 family)